MGNANAWNVEKCLILIQSKKMGNHLRCSRSKTRQQRTRLATVFDCKREQAMQKQENQGKAGNQHFRNNVKKFHCLSRYYTRLF